MIALLRGTVAAAGLGRVVVDVGGVGYEVLVPPGAVGSVAGDAITLHTSLVVREDAHTLYGFPAPADRDLFRTLLSVSGVGPKVALAALGTLGADRLRRAVVDEDVVALTVVPGVGRKGAQRMILELRERLGAEAVAAVVTGAGPAGPVTDPRAEVAEALASLGYAPAEVARTLERVAGDHPEAPAEDLLRAALKTLART